MNPYRRTRRANVGSKPVWLSGSRRPAPEMAVRTPRKADLSASRGPAARRAGRGRRRVRVRGDLRAPPPRPALPLPAPARVARGGGGRPAAHLRRGLPAARGARAAAAPARLALRHRPTAASTFCECAANCRASFRRHPRPACRTRWSAAATCASWWTTSGGCPRTSVLPLSCPRSKSCGTPRWPRCSDARARRCARLCTRPARRSRAGARRVHCPVARCGRSWRWRAAGRSGEPTCGGI